MANKYFIEKFTDEIESIIRDRERSENHERMATRGDMIEESTADLFSRYFPNRCGFGKGCVQDFEGNQSREVDIVVFDRDSIPPICHGIKSREEKRIEGFFPVESLWYAIEIKKKLNNTELKKAVENMNSVAILKSNKIPARMLFAYDSDLDGCDIKKEFERYKRVDGNWNLNPAIHVFCIIGKGYIFAQNATRNMDGKKVLLWKYVESQKNYFEIACCISGMINTITGQTFGSYIFDEASIKILEEIEL